MNPLRRVTLHSGEVFAATHVHYVYRLSTSNNINLVCMDVMRTGHFMILGNGIISGMVLVDDALESRFYIPQIICGDVLISGVIVSAYTAAFKPSTVFPLMFFARVAAVLNEARELPHFGMRRAPM